MKDNLREFFDYLNDNISYIILRNWEGVFDEGIYGVGHEDIDILCNDLNRFISLTGATRVHQEHNRDNFVVQIGSMKVRFDVRWVGDGYYPSTMEENLLNRRVFSSQSIFIPNEEDYYYSLAYHALIQKPSLSNEYLTKINEVRNHCMGISTYCSESEVLHDLRQYLQSNNWDVEYPCDPGVYINHYNLRNLPVNKKYFRLLNRFILLKKQIFLHYYHRVLCQR